MSDTPELDEWRKRIGDREADKKAAVSARFGTMVHDEFERILKKGDTEGLLYTSLQKQCIFYDAYDRTYNYSDNPFYKELWMKNEYYIKSLARIVRSSEECYIEQPLYSTKLGLAGRCDLIYRLFDERSGNEEGFDVLDFKNYRKYKTMEELQLYFEQTAAYGMMAHECLGIELPKNLVIFGTCADEYKPQITRVPLKDYIEPLYKKVKAYWKTRNVDNVQLYKDALGIQHNPYDTNCYGNIPDRHRTILSH